MLGSTRSRILTPLLIMCLTNCYDVHIQSMFDSSLPPVVCRRAHVLFTLFMFACAQQCLIRIDCMSGMVLSCGRWELLSLRGRLGSPPVLEGFMLLNVLAFCVVFCGLFVFVMCLLCPILPVSLDCPFLTAISVFFNVYFNSAH